MLSLFEVHFVAVRRCSQVSEYHCTDQERRRLDGFAERWKHLRECVCVCVWFSLMSLRESPHSFAAFMHFLRSVTTAVRSCFSAGGCSTSLGLHPTKLPVMWETGVGHSGGPAHGIESNKASRKFAVQQLSSLLVRFLRMLGEKCSRTSTGATILQPSTLCMHAR